MGLINSRPGGGSSPSSGGGGQFAPRRRNNRNRPNNRNGPNRPNNNNNNNRGQGPRDQGGGGGLNELGTGPGGLAFNNINNAVQGGLGLVQQGGVKRSPLALNQNAFMKSQMQAEYENFEARRMGRRGQDNFTWNKYLKRNFRLPRGTVSPTAAPLPNGDPRKLSRRKRLSVGMANAMRQRWARSSPTARGYFSEGWSGPGRTITG